MRTNDSTGQGPSESPTGHSITYSYDKLYRLTNAVYNGGISASYAYDYDPVGNMVAYTETIDSQVVSVTRSFNAINQITSETADCVGSKTISYDLNGNMTRIDPAAGSDESIKIYEYDQRNLMIAACENVACDTNIGMKTTFFYDGNSDRLAQVQFEDGVAVENTTYVNDTIGLTQVLVSENASGAVYMLYGHLMIGQQIAGSSQFETHITDGLGSVRVEIETSGAINYIRTFSPFGETLSESGNSRSVYGYTGQQEDESTGLIYLRARYYSADLKAFTAYDVWPGRAHQPQTLNHYAYTTGNPVNYLDPTGRCNGVLSFIRAIEPKNCEVYVDQATAVIQSDNANFRQRTLAHVTRGAFWVSHAGLAIGTPILAANPTAVPAAAMSVATRTAPIALKTGRILPYLGFADDLTTLGQGYLNPVNPEVQQDLIIMAQMAQADGSPLNPVGDIMGAAMFWGRRGISAFNGMNFGRMADDLAVLCGRNSLLTRSGVIEDLSSGGTVYSNQLAQLVKNGQLDFNILGEIGYRAQIYYETRHFDYLKRLKIRQSLMNSRGFFSPFSNTSFIRRSSFVDNPDLLPGTVVHELNHADISLNHSNDQFYSQPYNVELRAHAEQTTFNNVKGRQGRFSNINEIIDYLNNSNYYSDHYGSRWKTINE